MLCSLAYGSDCLPSQWIYTSQRILGAGGITHEEEVVDREEVVLLLLLIIIIIIKKHNEKNRKKKKSGVDGVARRLAALPLQL